MSQTKIVNCDCKHDYQDQVHGRGKRVANYSLKNKNFSCTVCGKKHS